MPNRIIKESIKKSEEINKLSFFEEVVYYRLIVTADDYGCCDGRTILLRNELFPLKENITKKAIEDAVSNLVKVGLLCSYKVNDIPYLFFPTWEKHQRIRNQFHKYPEPPKNGLTVKRQSIDGQMTDRGLPESESNPNPNQNQNPNPNPESNTGASARNDVNTILDGIKDDDLRNALKGFADNRKQLKKPMTGRAMYLAVKKLNELSSDPKEQIEIVNQSIMNGWQGLFALKKDKTENNSYVDAVKHRMDDMKDW